MTDIQKQLADALVDLVRAVQNLRNWPPLEHLKQLRESAQFGHLVSAWEDARDVLAAYRQQEACEVVTTGMWAEVPPKPITHDQFISLLDYIDAHGIKGE